MSCPEDIKTQLLGIQADPTINSEKKSGQVMEILTANKGCDDVLDNKDATSYSKPTETFKTISGGPKVSRNRKKRGGKRGNTRRRSRKSTRRKGRKSNGKKSKRRSRR